MPPASQPLIKPEWALRGRSCCLGIPTHHPRVYNIHSRNVTRYPANSIVVVGGCPVCRVGVLEDSFTFLGIFLAIVLFPFGFICCFALRKRRCPNCGANFT
ncbi:brain protein I3 isoform X2 [Sus scrofa]|uniref:brain protein I3 isoform X2 n=1 Tax=Sus scrofa TaxID=9823 RepID=UPI000A2B98A7|nr:brain protein I3 isoform X2 [Sus scrofa]